MDLTCYRCRGWPCECGACLIHGDCCASMAAMQPDSVDAVVTDPPYGLEFMGVGWDTLRENGKARVGQKFDVLHSQEHPRNASEQAHIRAKKNRASGEWHQAWATEALRVLKPGGHLLAFGGTRTFHRLTCALEDAGFEIRDCIMWLYGSGFPKSLDVSKAIDKAAGAERKVVGTSQHSAHRTSRNGTTMNCAVDGSLSDEGERFVTSPATDAARQWSGWGTALKPAWEPIIVARKPLSESNVAANVLKHGTGGINVDACRIPGEVPATSGTGFSTDKFCGTGGRGDATMRGVQWNPTEAGRWPANVILDDESSALLDQQSGERPGAVSNGKSGVNEVYNGGWGSRPQIPGYGDSGGASRFFYCAKADKQDRGSWNTHPTVKPTDLMRYLIRLVAPTGALILDPFAGSGTTLVAAVAEHCRVIGLEREAEYCVIAARRLQQKVLAFPEDAA